MTKLNVQLCQKLKSYLNVFKKQLKNEVTLINCEIKILKQIINRLDNEKRKNDIIIYGLKKTRQENYFLLQLIVP